METMTNEISKNKEEFCEFVELVADNIATDSTSTEMVKGSRGSKVALAIAGVGIAAAIGYKVYNHFKKKKTVEVDVTDTNSDDFDEDEDFIDVEINEEKTTE